MSEMRFDLMSGRYAEVGGGETVREDIPPHVSCADDRCREAVELEYAKDYGWKECVECDAWTCPDHQRPVDRDLPDIICTECKEWM